MVVIIFLKSPLAPLCQRGVFKIPTFLSQTHGKMGRWGKAKGDDMILVDTSVWIDFLIGRDTPGRSQLFAFELFTAVIAFQLVSLQV